MGGSNLVDSGPFLGELDPGAPCDSELSRVPAPVAVFTGRAAERAEIRQELAKFPVVTLVGPPGAGKTELARVVAKDLETSTVAYVDLSTLSVRSSLATTVATAVGLDPATTWDETVDVLGDTDTMLVLDNAETALAIDVDDFRRSLRDLVDRCRSGRILATSRERLGVTGVESIVRVGPLTPLEATDLLDKFLSSHASLLTTEDRDAMALCRFVSSYGSVPRRRQRSLSCSLRSNSTYTNPHWSGRDRRCDRSRRPCAVAH